MVNTLPHQRDEDANAAVDRARTFQRETSDLRRKLETVTATSCTSCANHGRAAKATAVIGRSDEKTVHFSDEAVGTGGGRRGSNDRGGADQQQQQQQQEREELEREVGRLRRELQEQREACAVAEAEGDELQATVEEASCMCCATYVAGAASILDCGITTLSVDHVQGSFCFGGQCFSVGRRKK